MIISKVRKILSSFKNVKSVSKVQKKRIGNYSNEILEALEKYANEIESVLISYNKKSCEETMMVKGLRKSSQETTNRKTHMENVEGIAVEIAKKIGLNEGVTRIIARNHDIGHTFLGHSGEWWFSNIKEDLGMGYYTHNALGPRELIYRNDIYTEIIKRIKSFNPEITEKELGRVRKSLWIIFDGINSHNGEKTETEFVPDTKKTEGDFLRELMLCFTEKGFDKTIMPATMEGALIRMCDKISYIPYDMLDGLREGFIGKLDDDYIKVLVALGISEREIEKCNITKNYESIARKLQITFTRDVIENSTRTAIRMSEEMSKLMHELRNINNRKIVDFVVLKEDQDTYPKAIRNLMKQFSKIILEGDLLERLNYAEQDLKLAEELNFAYEGTPAEGFIRYILGTTHGDYKFTREMIYEATRTSISEEQRSARQIVLGDKEFEDIEGFSNKSSRIKRYVDYYKTIGITGDYSEENISRDIEGELNNQIYGDKGQPSIMQEKIALEFAAKYMASLNDIEFFDLLRNTNQITESQAKSLTRTYREIGQEGLRREVQESPEWREIADEQVADTVKIGLSQADEDDEISL
ncbi:MAG: HD domain-containing protein [Clostridia bacterium]|nr:HD domain-containing protein [Clostridia bacterium]